MYFSLLITCMKTYKKYIKKKHGFVKKFRKKRPNIKCSHITYTFPARINTNFIKVKPLIGITHKTPKIHK